VAPRRDDPSVLSTAPARPNRSATHVGDQPCVSFLQWALPRLGMRWKGFRKVRRQVCRRIRKRMGDLGLPGFEAYRRYLEAHPEEWDRLRPLCRITISRFRRDRGVWRSLVDVVLPELIRTLPPQAPLRAWSAGCASGEEPYTLSILWRLELEPRFPEHALEVVATDVDPQVLQRSRKACYSSPSLKELEPYHVEVAFTASGAEEGGGSAEPVLRLRDEYREKVTFLRQDLLREMPEGPFHLVLCRNLAFTYFDAELQGRILEDLLARLAPGGALVIGSHETLPPREPPWPLVAWNGSGSIYRHEPHRTDGALPGSLGPNGGQESQDNPSRPERQ